MEVDKKMIDMTLPNSISLQGLKIQFIYIYIILFQLIKDKSKNKLYFDS